MLTFESWERLFRVVRPKLRAGEAAFTFTLMDKDCDELVDIYEWLEVCGLHFVF